jgi:ATP-dependent Clp endopeptidase proteolytic subunit ClpP
MPTKRIAKTNPKPEAVPASSAKQKSPAKQKSSTTDSNQDSLRIKLLQLQIDKAQCDLERSQIDRDKAQRDANVSAKATSDKATNAAKEAELKLAQLTAQVENEQLRLAKAKREDEIALSQASETMSYTFYDGVTVDSVKDCFATVSTWSRRFPGKPVNITLCSRGGSVTEGLMLYDFLAGLRSKGHYLTVTVLGMAASMGGILLQAADRRIVGENADVMIHEVAYGTQGKIWETEDRLEYINLLWERLLKILARRSTLKPHQIKKYCLRKDWWLSAQQAVEFGFADEVQEEPKFKGGARTKSKSQVNTTKPQSRPNRKRTGS